MFIKKLPRHKFSLNVLNITGRGLVLPFSPGQDLAVGFVEKSNYLKNF